jgi:MYXO-CTERM domain-containing protein
VLSLGLFSACDKGGGGGGGASNVPGQGPEVPEYDRVFDEFSDLPNQMGAQVAWAAQPITDAATLADEIATLRTEVDIDKEAFKGIFTAALTEGKFEVDASLDLGESRAAVEATLGRIKQVGVDLKDMPNRVKIASKALVGLGASIPKLALKATSELKGEIKVSTGDEKIQLQADLATVKDLPNQCKAELSEAKSLVASLPAKALASVTALGAAIAGQPYTKPEPIPGAVSTPTDTSGAATAPAPTGDRTTAEGGETTAATEATPAATDPLATEPPPATGAPRTATEEPAATEEAPAPEEAPIPVEVPSGAAGGAPAPGANAPAPVVDARVDKLLGIGDEAGERNDWLTTADAFEEAYVLKPTDQLLAFLAGEAAAKAKDCARAQPYLERFIEYGDATANADEMAQAKKSLGELKAFECPARTPEDEAARAETLALQAEALGSEDDWSGAAGNYAVAYQLDPENHLYAYQVAISSWNAHECSDATSYFTHFSSVAASRSEKAKVRSAGKYLERAAGGECEAWNASERDGHARSLYAQGQALEEQLDFAGAVGKYQRAYLMLPDNHALAWRIAATEWKATHCEPADKYARIFVSNASPDDTRVADDIPAAQGIIAKVDVHGCPDALWATGDTPANGGGELPPPVPKKGLCSLDPDSGSLPATLGLFVLASLGRRRRRRSGRSES